MADINARPPDEAGGIGGHGMPVLWTKEGGREDIAGRVEERHQIAEKERKR